MQAELTERHQQAQRLARRVLAVLHREKEAGATGISVGGAVDPMGGPSRLEKDLAQLPGERHGLAVWRGDNAEVGRWWKFNQAEDQLRVVPTASTMVSASTASTAQARKTESASPNSVPDIAVSMAQDGACAGGSEHVAHILLGRIGAEDDDDIGRGGGRCGTERMIVRPAQ